MNKAIPVVLAVLALTGCMNSYPLWDPPPQEPLESAQPASVSVQGRVVSVDADDESIEIETGGAESGEMLRIELGSSTVVYPEGSRDRAVSGSEGVEMITEDDTVVVSGLRMDDDVVRAREISIAKRVASPHAAAPNPAAVAPVFQPTQRVRGIIRAVDVSAGRIVLEVDGYGVVAFYGDEDTPVFYKGVIYQLPNLEIGDDATVTIGSTDDGDPATPWITAIEVTGSVSHEGASPAAKGAVPEPPKRDVQLEAIEIEGTVKRLEAQGFEIETGEGALRYVTADLLMPVAPATVERVSDLELGMKVRVRCLEVGERLVAQKVSLLE